MLVQKQTSARSQTRRRGLFHPLRTFIRTSILSVCISPVRHFFFGRWPAGPVIWKGQQRRGGGRVAGARGPSTRQPDERSRRGGGRGKCGRRGEAGVGCPSNRRDSPEPRFGSDPSASRSLSLSLSLTLRGLDRSQLSSAGIRDFRSMCGDNILRLYAGNPGSLCLSAAVPINPLLLHASATTRRVPFLPLSRTQVRSILRVDVARNAAIVCTRACRYRWFISPLLHRPGPADLSSDKVHRRTVCLCVCVCVCVFASARLLVETAERAGEYVPRGWLARDWRTQRARRRDKETKRTTTTTTTNDTVIPSVIVKLMAKGTRPRVSTRCGNWRNLTAAPFSSFGGSYGSRKTKDETPVRVSSAGVLRKGVYGFLQASASRHCASEILADDWTTFI